MARSRFKLLFFSKQVWRLLLRQYSTNQIQRNEKVKHFYIFSKHSYIPADFHTQRFYIHKGLEWKELHVNPYMAGYKFGEFLFTRKPFYFPIKKKKKKK